MKLLLAQSFDAHFNSVAGPSLLLMIHDALLYRVEEPALERSFSWIIDELADIFDLGKSGILNDIPGGFGAESGFAGGAVNQLPL
jgi:hypothetical protein